MLILTKTTIATLEATMSPPHPYYPPGADIMGYSPNKSSVVEILISAGGGCTALLALTFAMVSYVQPSLRLADRIAVLWFVLCRTAVSFNIE